MPDSLDRCNNSHCYDCTHFFTHSYNYVHNNITTSIYTIYTQISDYNTTVPGLTTTVNIGQDSTIGNLQSTQAKLMDPLVWPDFKLDLACVLQVLDDPGVAKSHRWSIHTSTVHNNA